MAPVDMAVTEYRCGFVAVIGRPNAGKSTLVNALVGAKVAITSSRPQTTRRILRGILTTDDFQLILVDTPGVHRPRTLLGERLNAEVTDAVAGVDVVGLCLPANEAIGPGDRRIAASIKGRQCVAILTKVDTVSRDVIAERLAELAAFEQELGEQWAAIVPVSAVKSENLDALRTALVACLPSGPALFPTDRPTDEAVEVSIAELIREAALEGAREELPHSIAVVVEEIVPREDRSADAPLTDVRAEIFVERDSQKAIIIGKGGSRLKQIGSQARRGIEGLLGTAVFLDLRVKVAKDWQRDPRQLRRLGL